MKYHGLAEVEHCKTEEALSTASALWFVDGGRRRAAGSHRRHPSAVAVSGWQNAGAHQPADAGSKV